MNEQQFWNIIALCDWSHESDDEAVLQQVIRNLAILPFIELQSFDELVATKLFALDTEQHANLTEDYFSADLFLYNRCYVVAHGQVYYEHVLTNPLQMPTGIDNYFESLLYVTQDAAEKQGIQDYQDFTAVSYETFSNEEGWKHADFSDGLPRGNRPKR